MKYRLRGGEEVRNGVLYGWTGAPCPTCRGTGEDEEARACHDCAGTGDHWGRMPTQPPDAPWCFLESGDLDLIYGADVCRDCEGSGVGFGFDVCQSCAGTGTAGQGYGARCP